MKIYAKQKGNGKVLPYVVAAVGILALFKGVSALQSGTNGIIFIGAGILLLAVGLYRPETVFDREGVDQIFSILFFKKHTMWKWEDISRLFADYNKAKPDVVIVIQKTDARNQKLNVLREDVPQIIEWAAAANARMTIRHNGDVDINVPGRETMSEDEYYAAKEMEASIKPKNFHEFAAEARKIKAEKEQIVAEARKEKMLKKAKPKRNDRNLKGWK